MNVDRAVMMFAGVMILLSLALTRWVHPGWVWLTVFVGLNLFQASITGFCPAAWAFRRLGLATGTAFGQPDTFRERNSRVRCWRSVSARQASRRDSGARRHG